MAEKKLIVLVRGWGNETDFLLRVRRDRGGDFPAEFVEELKKREPNADILQVFPKSGKRGNTKFDALSTACPNRLSDLVVEAIDGAMSQPDCPYDSITIVSYSTGSLLTRAAIATIFGIDLNGCNCERKPWHGKVHRWVSLAGILRGWNITSSTSIAGRIFGRPALWGLKLARPNNLLLAQVERGMPFVVNSRLRQIALEEAAETDDGLVLPQMINLLGTTDDIVSPADCLEPSPSSNEIFWEVPGTGHLQILDLTGPDSEKRKKIVLMAILGTKEKVREPHDWVVAQDDLNDFFDEFDRPIIIEAANSTERVTHAVIVMHGIRDHGFWTKRIGRRIKRLGGRTFNRAPSPGYGYFSVLDFMNVWRRKKQARWLLEQYADIRSCFRGAKISFVGHSNGTYLLKSAMDIAPTMRFKHIYLAGSVLRTDVDWSRYAGDASDSIIQGKILNVRANRDWVVGMLPFAMQKMGLKFLDVGGAGYDGFENKLAPNRFREITVHGPHQAGVRENSWDMVADFTMQGTFPITDDAPRQRDMDVKVAIAPWLLALAVPIFILLVELATRVLSALIPPIPSLSQALFGAGDGNVGIQLGFAFVIVVAFGKLARLF